MSIYRKCTAAGLALAVALGMTIGGCENLPGGEREQGAVLGGAGGAATGAVIAGEGDRLTGALIGGLLGAGGGYLIGRELEDDEVDIDEARQANEQARQEPATVNEALAADSADLNNDGFVTLDEVVAMERAGLTNEQMIDRLAAANQVYELTPSQQQFLRDRGVDPAVIDAMLAMRAPQDRDADQVIGSPQ